MVAPEDRQEQDMVLRDVESMTASLEAMQRYLRPVDEDDSDLPVVPLHGFMGVCGELFVDIILLGCH